MIAYPGFMFAAPPRTGSTWFIHACSLYGLGDGIKSKVHIPFPDGSSNFTVSLVRHPYSWLVSYYHALKGGAVNVVIVDKLCSIAATSETVEVFILRYLDQMPGHVTMIFDEYKASTVMRLEDFPWAPLEFFASIALNKKGAQDVRALMPVNATKGEYHKPNKSLKCQVVDAEKELCERYNYYS